MNSLFSGLTSAFPAWATAFAASIGSLAMPGCPQPQTPRAITPDSETRTTPTVSLNDSMLVVPEVRPVTIPQIEPEAVLLP